MGEYGLGKAVILVTFARRADAACTLALAIPYSLSFKPGHLSTASSTRC